MSRKNNNIPFYANRFWVLLIGLGVICLALIARLAYLTIFDRDFLEHQADVRILRTVDIPAYRGMILSSDSVPLAISIPVDTVWINPQDFPATTQNVNLVSKILGISSGYFWQILHQNAHRQFAYLKRDASEEAGQQIQKLSLPGIYIERDYHRYYPQGAVTSHVVGFTDIDDQGQEGLELTYNNWLQGVPGKRQVLKDRLGHIVAVVDTLQNAKPGQSVVLSINSKIQYLAYQVLKDTVDQVHAKSGSAIVLNPKTGEILAMVNQPDFDPNKPHTPPMNRYRNRAVTDLFEPGSTMKTFSIFYDLQSGRYRPDSIIDTSPGWIVVGGHKIDDDGYNLGPITVTQVLQKSSSVGSAKMTLSLPPQGLVDLLQKAGFGAAPGSGYPGETSGAIPQNLQWHPLDLATLSFGYTISVNALQLVHAYAAIANQGKQCPVTFLKQDEPVNCPQALDPKISGEMLNMLQSVLQPGGTGTAAKVPGYSVAGKTGTAAVAGKHGYDDSKWVSSFVGIAPVSDPQLVVAVIIHDPATVKGYHYGGFISAPAFSKIMAGALRILNVPPDQLTTEQQKVPAPFPENN